MGGAIRLGCCASAVALATGHAAYAQSLPNPVPAPAPTSIPSARTLTFSVPLVSPSRAFGEVSIEVSGETLVAIDAVSLRRELSETLNEEGIVALDRAIAGQALVSPGALSAAGFDLEFDTAQLQLFITKLSPQFLKTRSIGGEIEQATGVKLETLSPAQVSSYLNLTGNFDYDRFDGIDNPDFFFDGATRVGRIVVEYDGALTDQFSDAYRFARRSTRAVYDDPSSYRRYSAGDLRLNTLSIMRTPQIGGIGVEKSRQIFDPGLSVRRISGRQIFLDNRSTVDVLINGAQYDSFQLDAGTYDLADLPIQQGSNAVELRVRDSFGRQQIIAYNFFSETLSLPAGEEEYSLGIGVVSQTLRFSPDYSGPLAASGYYRRALSENLVLGGALQASGSIQVLGGTMSVVPQVVPGVFDLEAAGSRSRFGTGFAFRGGYRLTSGNGFDRSSQLAVNLDYESSNFTTIDGILPVGFDLLTVSGSYSRSLSIDTFATLGATYLSGGDPAAEDYNLFAEINHRLSNRLRLTGGVEYGTSRTARKSFGVHIGIAMALGGRTRASADYRSRVDSFRANLSRGASNDIGSFGYDVGVSRFGSDTQTSLQLQYVANRFDARANLSSSGRSFGRVFDDPRARLQIGTSIGFADGVFGVGRPISDSFLLARPDPAIADQSVVTARTISRGQYYGESGLLGAAVQGDLSAYNQQSIQFDAADPANGFDVGDGIIQVDPPYKSGYKLTVGSPYYKSVIGKLVDGQKPVEFVAGRVISADGDKKFTELPFFTNASGRFGIFGLAPGHRYYIVLDDTGRRFSLDVPVQGEAVVRVGEISLPADPKEQQP